MSEATRVRSCQGCKNYYLSKEEYERDKGLSQKRRHNCPYISVLDCEQWRGGKE